MVLCNVVLKNAFGHCIFAGDSKCYRARDSGKKCLLNSCSAPLQLHLKVGAPVILTVNLAPGLVNGSRGTVQELGKDSVTVSFTGLQRDVVIERFNFTMYDSTTGLTGACRSQLPLLLGFAFTVHRAQGLTLSRVEIDCTRMTQPGQIGVALGRAKDKKGLRVLHFDPRKLIPQTDDILEFYQLAPLDLNEDLSCCRASHVPNVALPDINHLGPGESTQDEDDDDAILLAAAQVIDEMPVDEDEELLEALQLVDDMLAVDTDVSQDMLTENTDDPQYIPTDETDGHQGVGTAAEGNVPVDTSISTDMITDHLRHSKYEIPTLRGHQEMNDNLAYFESNQQKTKSFADDIWKEMSSLFQQEVPNPKKITNLQLTRFYKDLFLYRTGPDYIGRVALLYGVQEASDSQVRAALEIFNCVRRYVVGDYTKGIKEDARKDAENNPRKELTESSGGLGKKRYLCGWCISKLRHSRRVQIRRNLYKAKEKAKVEMLDRETKYLDQLVATESFLFENSEHKESLAETKRKQNVNGGLTNVTDSAYTFFSELDKTLMSYETKQNMDLYGEEIYMHITKQLHQNQTLFQSWLALFTVGVQTSTLVDGEMSDDDVDMEHVAVVHYLYEDVIQRYIRMSSAQFRRAYLQQMKNEKTEAHRKQVKIPKKKDVRKSGICETNQGKTDKANRKPTNRKKGSRSSVDQQSSVTVDGTTASQIPPNHDSTASFSKERLRLEIEKNASYLESRAVTKKDLQLLCTTHGVSCSSKMKKSEGVLLADTPDKDIDTSMEGSSKSEGEQGTSFARKNPGRESRKRKFTLVEYPCLVCGADCDNSNCVCCDGCNEWTHYACVNLNGDEGELDNDYYCEHCC